MPTGELIEIEKHQTQKGYVFNNFYKLLFCKQLTIHFYTHSVGSIISYIAKTLDYPPKCIILLENGGNQLHDNQPLEKCTGGQVRHYRNKLCSINTIIWLMTAVMYMHIYLLI